MSSALWRSGVARALHLNRSLVYARYVQLATVRADGRPANRTVVFRGFLEPDRLKFIADDRSQKITQLAAQSWAEVCWYFPKSREQFRLLGRLHVVQFNDPNSDLLKARQQQWQDLSDAARIQFAWADPGQPRADASAFDPPAPDPAEPLPNFCLLLLDPIEVDHLELRGEPQNRTLYQYSPEQQAWSQEAVNP
jgi:PPOX class probable FMN-dependent enzyme